MQEKFGAHMAKNIILLSDGTGNSAHRLTKSNVWRLYRALDLSDETKQVAFYDDGVGTEQFKPLKLIGGAFGYGLRRNVIDLYEFLCRNYDKGDHIYLFGFSRGAYTVRTVADLVSRCGLVSRSGNNGHALRKAAKDKYRIEYRGGFTLPLIERLIRKVRGYEHAVIPPSRAGHAGTEIAFVGVWDTVSAYGFPIEGIQNAWSNWVYRLNFGDQNLPNAVVKACQALSIDDERRTFRPILWNEKDGIDRTADIDQVWFAGAHSNVGGGYPKDELAYLALDWMISKVDEKRVDKPGSGKSAHRLRLHEGEKERIKNLANTHGPQYDSRSGLKAFYRYKPRNVAALSGQDEKERQASKVLVPVVKVHESVLRRTGQEIVSYAPISLPQDFSVVGGGLGKPATSRQAKAAEKYAEDAMNAARGMADKRKSLYWVGAALAGLIIATPIAWLLVWYILDDFYRGVVHGPWLLLLGAFAVFYVPLKMRYFRTMQEKAAEAWENLKQQGKATTKPKKLQPKSREQ